MDAEMIPVWNRILLTIDEAAMYCHVSSAQIRKMLDTDDGLYLRNGNRRLIKRKRLEEYIDSATDIT